MIAAARPPPAMGVSYRVSPLTQANFRDVLAPLLGAGDFLLNLSVDVSSVALIGFCREVGALYLDTCVEPWAGGYTDPSLSASQRSNYGLRESALALAAEQPAGPTALITHGANPGLVSHFVKQALLNLATRYGPHGAGARDAGGMGRARPDPVRQGHPHRRARHAACRYPEAAG